MSLLYYLQFNSIFIDRHLLSDNSFWLRINKHSYQRIQISLKTLPCSRFYRADQVIHCQCYKLKRNFKVAFRLSALICSRIRFTVYPLGLTCGGYFPMLSTWLLRMVWGYLALDLIMHSSSTIEAFNWVSFSISMSLPAFRHNYHAIFKTKSNSFNRYQ